MQKYIKWMMGYGSIHRHQTKTLTTETAGMPATHNVGRSQKAFSQLLFRMKLVAILMIAGSLAASAEGYTQSLTIQKNDVLLKEVFKEIERQTNYQFFFNERLLKGTKKVSIQLKNASLEAVLDACFEGQPVSYKIVDKTIVLIKSKSISKSPNDDATNAIMPPIDISGKVTDEDGNPLMGANVKVKGTNKGTTTDNEGVFILKNVEENGVLEISFIGYQTISVSVGNRTSIIAGLKKEVEQLQEVVVRKGYYDEKRTTTVSSVSSITAKDIEKQPINNPLLALQGRVTGAEIIQVNGLPGAAVQVKIRGQNSIANGYNPLYIIDGVPYPAANLPSALGFFLGSSGNGGAYASGNPFSYLNPSDIESIDILKDADATAIYGSRGANGVILIRTKGGKRGRMRVEMNVQTGFGKVATRIELLNTRQYLDMRYEAFRNDGAVPNPNVDYDLTLWDTTRYTDWQKELIGGTAKYHEAQLAISGGAENIQYRIASTYHKETTVFPGDFSDQKASVQFNINGRSQNQKFDILLSGLYTKDDNRLSSTDLTETALQLAPNAPALYNEDGSINWAPTASGYSSWQKDFPAAQMLRKYQSNTGSLISNVVAGYKILENLNLKTSLGYSSLQSDFMTTNPLSSYDPAIRNTIQRSSRFQNSKIESWIIEPQLDYNLKILKGSVNVVLGTTFQQNNSTSESFTASGFNSDDQIENIGFATTLVPDIGVDRLYKYNAVFGRVNYNKDDRYIINLTGRRDGSSRFGPANQFNNFGSVGAAWVFTNESFAEKIFRFLSFGKIRMSYGLTGNDQVGDYSFMDIYSPNPVGVPYQGVQGIRPDRIFTPDLAWEETEKMEGGVDLGFLSDRLNLSVNYYRNRSYSQLLGYAVPTITGFSSVTKNLDAVVQNSGLEVEIRSLNINKRDFQWSSFFNISANRNKLASVSDEISQYYQDRVGLPLSIWKVYKYIGVDFITGLYQVADISGNPVSNPKPEDAQTMVDIVPKFTGGLQNSLRWRSFQLDFLFQFVYDVDAPAYLYNYIPGFFGSITGPNQPVTVLNRWQKPGDIAIIQRFSQNSSTASAFGNARNSDQLYEDASYVRLKNISFSWSMPEKWRKATRLQNAKVFVHGQNLYTITNYEGLDPESAYNLHLPPLRVITMGLNVTL